MKIDYTKRHKPLIKGQAAIGHVKMATDVKGFTTSNMYF